MRLYMVAALVFTAQFNTARADQSLYADDIARIERRVVSSYHQKCLDGIARMTTEDGKTFDGSIAIGDDIAICTATLFEQSDKAHLYRWSCTMSGDSSANISDHDVGVPEEAKK